MTEICRVEILRHVRKIIISDKIRPKYYEWNGIEIKAKGKKIPLKYLKEQSKASIIITPFDLNSNYYIGIFKQNKLVGKLETDSELVNLSKFKYRLCDTITNQPIIANNKAANNPRWYLIKGQDIYSGNLHPFTRVKVMNAIKDQFIEHIKGFLSPINQYPIRIECHVYDTVKNYYDKHNQDWDIDNYSYPYMKAFPDVLQSEGIIVNDDRIHVTQPPSPIFFPINEHNQRKLVFIIYRDEREELKQHEAYKPFYTKNEETFETEDNDLIKDDDEIL